MAFLKDLVLKVQSMSFATSLIVAMISISQLVRTVWYLCISIYQGCILVH